MAVTSGIGWKSAQPSRGLIAGLLVVVMAAGAVALWQIRRTAPATTGAGKATALTVTVAPVERGRMKRTLLVTGSLAARDELPIGTETSGLALAEILVDIGDHVRQGQLLARFDDRVLRAQLLQAEAALREAQANSAEATANARRAEELIKAGWISGKDYDNRRATQLTMQARVGVAQANLALASAKLQQAEVRAPSDGTINARGAHLGAVPTPGGGELFRLIRDDHIELVAEVPEAEIGQIRVGQNVQLTIDGGSAHADSISGRVRLVEPSVDVRTRLGRLRIEVEKGGLALPGMFVSGRVGLGDSDVLQVPEKAVVYQDGKPLLFVIDADGKADSRTVSLGARAQGRIAVLSGVGVGERVALQGAGYLKNGDRVSISEPATEADARTGVATP